jgi:hypothetical protein
MGNMIVCCVESKSDPANRAGEENFRPILDENKGREFHGFGDKN